MKKIYFYILLFSTFLSLVTAIFVLVTYQSPQRVAYVNISKVIKEFELSKTYQADIEANVSKQKVFLDSMTVELSTVISELNKSSNGSASFKLIEARRDSLYSRIQYLDKAFANNNQEMLNKYNEEVFTQINQYVEEYGKQRNYSLILGAKGDGTIMFGSEEIDITDEIVVFINQAYLGEQ
ncbi:MAG: hypothetical protein A2W93_09710 [Bacteroidetes bacterium GWF2_43_63]|nr:MAG: hypothetical protein A2W94_07195 [Bacteroidetes bacterium GWE2_42_42]OFY54582.1 MAG: hypothetical protein A2W93_09710 [Bacteroidetes bacterium GWF2_43_63]HBG70607.1 hypothetical protein [Bacteroidales bacterium]HCB60904.1 hypothetical protein [Bacteroidales bacterium]